MISHKLPHRRTTFVFVMLLAIGCSRKEQPSISPGSTSSPATTQEPKPIIEYTFTAKGPNLKADLGKTDHTFSAAEWYAEFKKDFSGALAKYRGKVIELSGVVAGFDVDYGNVKISLQTDAKSNDRVRCFSVEPNPWLKVTPGAKIRVKGILPDVVTVGILGHVEILDAGAYTTPSLMAEELARDHVANRKETEGKYKNQWVHLSGVIAKKNKPDGTVVTLQGDGDVVIQCLFAGFGKDQPLEKLKEGAKLNVCGRLVWDMNDKIIHLVDGLLTESK